MVLEYYKELILKLFVENQKRFVFILVGLLIILSTYATSYADITPVSDRTPQVRDAIVAAIPEVNAASDVTAVHLAAFSGTLNLRNKNITALAAGDFDGLSALQIIDLGDNQLVTLPEDVFNGLSFLKGLYLYGNQLTSLPEDLFDGLTTLKYLYGNNNHLTSLPEDLFDGLTALTTVNLHTNRLASLHENLFEGNTRLRDIFLHRNHLTNLPEDVFNGLSSLIYLYLYHNRLTSLPPDVFSGLSSLEQLLLNNNQISTLPDEIFQGLTGLTLLQLEGNTLDPFHITVSLVEVATNQFKATIPTGAPFAITLTLDITNGSGINTITIPKGSMESEIFTATHPSGTYARATLDISDSLPGLPVDEHGYQHNGYQLTKSTNLPLPIIYPLSQRKLQVRNAILRELQGVSVNNVTAAHLTSITSLNLDRQRIIAPTSSDFDGLTALTDLSLNEGLGSSNIYTTLQPGIFDQLTSLTTLNLANNNVLGLPPSVIDQLTNLVTLDLSNNVLGSNLSRHFVNLTNLKTLDLSRNSMGSLPDDVFDQNTKLTTLNLANNSLSSLPEGVFDQLMSLNTLDLRK